MSTRRKRSSQKDTCVPATSLATTSNLIGASCILPEAIMVEILSRVPVNSILRFKCVCKSWLSLFSDPNFINLHRRRTSLDPENQSFITRRGGRIHLFDFNPIETPVKYIRLPCQNCVLNVVGVCNGMVLLNCSRLGKEMILWNPATHRYKTIKVKKEETVDGSTSSSEKLLTGKVTLGFGLEVKEDSFICLRIVSKRLLNLELGVEADIYSTSANSWRKLHVPVQFNITAGLHNCVIVNGVPFWEAVTNGADNNNLRNILVSFDARNEVFNQLEFPKTPHNSTDTSFTELNNCLASLVYYGLLEPVEIWMFDDKSGWRKNFTIGPILTAMGTPRCTRDRIVVENGFLENLFAIGTRLHNAEITNLYNGNECIVGAHKYAKSLVSVNGMKEVKRITGR